MPRPFHKTNGFLYRSTTKEHHTLTVIGRPARVYRHLVVTIEYLRIAIASIQGFPG